MFLKTKVLTLTTMRILNLTCKIWWEKVFRKPRHGWKDNIKTDFRVQNRILYPTFFMTKFLVLLHQNSANNCLRNTLYKGIQIYITLGLLPWILFLSSCWQLCIRVQWNLIPQLLFEQSALCMDPASSTAPPSLLSIRMPLIELQYKYLQLKH